MLVLCRRVIAGLLTETLEKRRHMEARCVYDFKKAVSEAASCRPHIALVEIPEKNGYPAAETLELCGEIKKASPSCKIVLMCPEQDKESVYICTEAKKKNEIEGFLFYDTTVDYLVAILESLLPA